jgi:hypothetical protein
MKPARVNSSQDPILEKANHTKIGLVEWLKVKALSSRTSTVKKKKKRFCQQMLLDYTSSLDLQSAGTLQFLDLPKSIIVRISSFKINLSIYKHK